MSNNPLDKNNEGYESGCRITDEILRRSAEEIRAEVARVAPHWRKYEQERAERRAAVAAENAKYPGILHGLDEKPFRLGQTVCWCNKDEFCVQCDPDAERKCREAWEGDALTQARRKLAIEEAKLSMGPKYVRNLDGTLETYESFLLSNEGKQRIADLNWSYRQENDVHLMSEEVYQRITPWWKRVYNWFRNLFTS